MQGDEIKQVYQAESSIGENKEIWLQRRLGHPSFSYLKLLFPSLFKNKDISQFKYENCEYAKQHRASFPVQIYEKSCPFILIHSDIQGPSRVKTNTRVHWFITFIDDHTRVCWMYLLKEKLEAAGVFKQFHKMILNQIETNIKILCTDNGREYCSNILGEYLQKEGIIHHSSFIMIMYWHFKAKWSVRKKTSSPS